MASYFLWDTTRTMLESTDPFQYIFVSSECVSRE